MNKSIELESQYGAHNYHPLPVVLTRGEGVYLWDDAGNKYLDMMSAYSAVSHGHAHPRLVKTLTEQAAKLAVCSRAFHSEKLGAFLKRRLRTHGHGHGADHEQRRRSASRPRSRRRANGPTRSRACPPTRPRSSSAAATSTAAPSPSWACPSEEQYKDGFGPFPGGFKIIPYGDAEALEKAITPNTAAFLVEPIQGEAGIVMPPAGYLKKCAELCRKHNVLLIADEIQTGFGRTGKLLACDHEGVKPDGLILGKALGGGLLPVSAFLARRDVMAVFTPGDHGSTFGGNAAGGSRGSRSSERAGGGEARRSAPRSSGAISWTSSLP